MSTFPVAFSSLLGADNQTLWDAVTGGQARAEPLRAKQPILCLFKSRHRNCIHYLVLHL